MIDFLVYATKILTTKRSNRLTFETPDSVLQLLHRAEAAVAHVGIVGAECGDGGVGVNGRGVAGAVLLPDRSVMK